MEISQMTEGPSGGFSHFWISSAQLKTRPMPSQAKTTTPLRLSKVFSSMLTECPTEVRFVR